jgi:DNA repair exonuclease SbcCD ATPase subunit
MAFEPESNFEKFVREFLLEPGMPDVKAVKASVDAHRRAQERLEKMHDQLERLKRIATHHQDWLTSRRESALYSHLSDALKHEEALEGLTRSRAELEEKLADDEENRKSHEQALEERERLRRSVEAARAALGDKAVRLEENDRRRREVTNEIERLEAASSSLREKILKHLRHWQDWTLHAARLGLQDSADASAAISGRARTRARRSPPPATPRMPTSSCVMRRWSSCARSRHGSPSMRCAKPRCTKTSRNSAKVMPPLRHC